MANGVAVLVVAAGLWRLGLISAGVDYNRIYFGTDTNAFRLLAAASSLSDGSPGAPP